jgi:hypothetical protein
LKASCVDISNLVGTLEEIKAPEFKLRATAERCNDMDARADAYLMNEKRRKELSGAVAQPMRGLATA